MDILGKTAVVTGAGKGIGRAIATMLVEKGARAALVARSFSPLATRTETYVSHAGTKASKASIDSSHAARARVGSPALRCTMASQKRHM